MPPSSHLPLHPTPLGCHRALTWAPCVPQQIPTGYLLCIWWWICFSATLSVHPTLSFPCCVCKSVLYVCISIAALQIDSSILFFYIPYICINIQCLFFSFWLTSLCMIGSRFIHLIRTDSSVFLFHDWVIFHCVYVPKFLYPFNCWWTSRLLPYSSYCK